MGWGHPLFQYHWFAVYVCIKFLHAAKLCAIARGYNMVVIDIPLDAYSRVVGKVVPRYKYWAANHFFNLCLTIERSHLSHSPFRDAFSQARRCLAGRKFASSGVVSVSKKHRIMSLVGPSP